MGCDLKLADRLRDTYESILTPDSMTFLSALFNKFDSDVDSLLAKRVERQEKWDSGEFPDFLSETATIRQADWKVAEIPPALRDRRVEITGPVDRKMVINALNSGANTYMADFEDSSSPTWSVMMDGQVNLLGRLFRPGFSRASATRSLARGTWGRDGRKIPPGPSGQTRIGSAGGRTTARWALGQETPSNPMLPFWPA